MRRLATLGFLLALSACSSTETLSSSAPDITIGNPFEDYVGSPFSGMGGFLVDTHTVFRNPNRPEAVSLNMQRMTGKAVAADPLLPDEGNVWPGPIQPSPTLSDLARSMDAQPSPQVRSGKPGGLTQ